MQSPRERNFISDNNAGICPEALTAMEQANQGHVAAYGTDQYTAEACDLIRQIFETDCEVFFIFSGTAANSLALAAMCQPYHSVICHTMSHIQNDECGGPEFFGGGFKLLTVSGPNGKITPEALKRTAQKRTDLHFPKVGAVSLTEATEVGTVYSILELEALRSSASDLNLLIHMDGARFANAVATLQCSPKEISWKVGVDVLSFGGTKNGMAVGEALIFFNKDLSREFEYRCKQAGHLSSKMRYLSAPWVGVLKEDTWLKYAKKSNTSAGYLRDGLKSLGLKILFPVEANGVFLQLDERLMAGMLYRGWKFYDFIPAGGCRLMCSWDTTREDVDQFVSDMADLIASDEDRRDEVELLQH